MEKFLVTKGPYLRSADQKHNTKNIMIDLIIALAPVILFSIYKNVIREFIKRGETGASIYQCLYPLILLILAPLFSLLCELLCLLIMHKDKIKNFKDLWAIEMTEFGIFPGLFIVMISPSYTPIWVMLVSVAVGEIVGKMLFGGFGQNIFNPAIIGRAFMAFTFADQISGAYMTPYEMMSISFPDAIASATPLQYYASIEDIANITSINVFERFGGFTSFFLGTIPGALAETSTLCILIGAIYLSVKKVIDWRIPVVYVGVVFITTMFIGFRLHQGLWYPLYQILSGGLMFGAVFMATEPVTSPKTPLARIIYSVFLGLLTVLFRLIGSMPEGVATAIVTMNIFGLAINQWALRVRIDGHLTKKSVSGLIIMSVLASLLFVYVLIFAV